MAIKMRIGPTTHAHTSKLRPILAHTSFVNRTAFLFRDAGKDQLLAVNPTTLKK
jgi:hypothetical protein